MNHDLLASPSDRPVVDGLPSDGRRCVAENQYLRPLEAGATSLLFRAAMIVCVGLPLVLDEPDWACASWIGCVWGGLVLCGLDCSWSRQRLWSLVYGLSMLGLGQRALIELTDLQHNACWVVAVLTATSGWLLGCLATPWTSGQRRASLLDSRLHQSVGDEANRVRCGLEQGLGKVSSGRPLRCTRWTLWDIAGLATSVACLSWLLPRVENQVELLGQLVPPLVCGALASLIAIEWAWRDRWSGRRLIAIGLSVASMAGLCVWWMPGGLDWRAAATWLLAGPASAIAAQGVTVLTAMAALRLDTHLASTDASAYLSPSSLAIIRS